MIDFKNVSKVIGTVAIGWLFSATALAAPFYSAPGSICQPVTKYDEVHNHNSIRAAKNYTFVVCPILRAEAAGVNRVYVDITGMTASDPSFLGCSSPQGYADTDPSTRSTTIDGTDITHVYCWLNSWDRVTKLSWTLAK